MRQIVRYAAVGLVNTALGYSLILVGLAAGLGDYLANALGFGVGLCISFLANRRFTFEQTDRIALSEVARFLVCFTMSYSANLMVIALGHAMDLQRNPLIHLAGIVVYSALFFVLMQWRVFVTPREGRVRGSKFGDPGGDDM
jgi:putative flippase GtrA